ncbi:MAG: hypothetical protein EFT35_07205 [Methanophagales archaeon ANME-1-THS]|nr:MAG: hypothetical protein EFT35_07205 [Methanophagales archaeon ANME-1-THS]
MKRLLILSLLFMLLLPHAQALQMLSGDQVSVDSAIEDDLFAAGNTVTLNAPVAGAVLAGGNITVNAPISGDLFALGGHIVVNADVGGKIVAAGGEIEVTSATKNAVIAGGTVTIHPDTVISRDAVIAGGTVTNAGRIIGNLTVRAENFYNTGSAGSVDFKQTEGLRGFRTRVQALKDIIYLLMTVGFLILGIIVLKVFPAPFFIVEEEVRKSPLKNTLVGFVLIIASVILIILIAVTIVGFPVAFIMGMLLLIALMLSSLFVSFALGRKIMDLCNVKTNDLLIFILGYVVLRLLFLIPYAGWFIRIGAISLGFGAIMYAVYKHRPGMTTPRAVSSTP